MAELTDLLARHLDGFLLAFFRVGAMLAWAPGLGHRSVPLPHRAGLAALLAFIMTPTLTGSAREPARDALGWLLAVAGEVFVGLAIGFVAYLVLAAVEVAGELIGFEMGFSIAAVFDPAMGEQGTVVARFLHLLAMLLFLTMNGHHLLIRAVAVSFQRIRPGGVLEPAVAGGVVSLGGKLLQSGYALAAPLVGILLVLNVALALVGRVAPQTNVFLVGLPLSIGLGILGLLDDLPSFAQVFARLITDMPADIDVVFLGASHGLR
jgi:flagellar biosynthetic protein FliR